MKNRRKKSKWQKPSKNSRIFEQGRCFDVVFPSEPCIYRSPNERTLRIPVKISVNNQIIKTTAIIDCGATGSFIDTELVALANFPLKKLDRQVKAYNVDGTTNSKGNIIWETNIDLLFPKHRENIKLMVLNLGQSRSFWVCPGSRSGTPTSTGLTDKSPSLG